MLTSRRKVEECKALTGGHYFNPKHAQEGAYDFEWERAQLRRYENMGYLSLVPSHKREKSGRVVSERHACEKGS